MRIRTKISVGFGCISLLVGIVGYALGQLAGAFNNMVRDLRNSTASMDNLNREINDRAATQESLRKARSFLQTIIDGIPDPSDPRRPRDAQSGRGGCSNRLRRVYRRTAPSPWRPKGNVNDCANWDTERPHEFILEGRF